MNIEQLQFFPTKKSFDSADFETPSNPYFFQQISASVFEGFDLFSKDNNHYYDKTTKSNMLNNAIAFAINKNCSGPSFSFIPSLSNTRRSIGILDDKYVLMFKKSPVSNLRTHQDDLIKYQQLDKHVLFLTYVVDDFWSEIKKVEFKYYSTPIDIIYTYNITNIEQTKVKEMVAPTSEQPIVKIKKTANRRKKAQ
ncbi:hypothetical protein J8L88_22010 [Aquimarina sp. MMG015]|uniref:hypothetical protein n=1 Tax=Aquimarina sp. MMG015 TaxID=2822689 RepID=UPI001B3A4082|nr:hypothetical protein [Aquimarina sp. MMG015]MBQ4805554.1 hypothetical protein [Aquimarina sp. MMG015]